MRLPIYLHCLLLLLASHSLPAGPWLTDLGAAKLRVAAENKPLLMLFTGSDWCPACQTLKREILARPEFASYADANLILLELDFPRHRVLPGTQKQANDSLAKAYQVRYFPTMILLDTSGQEVVRPRYEAAGVQGFLTKLDRYVHRSSPAARRITDREGTPSAPAPLFNGAATAPPPYYNDLVLKSISGTASRRFALINNQTLAPGESARVKLADSEVRVRCLEIRPQSVLITVDGKGGQRELKLAGTQ